MSKSKYSFCKILAAMAIVMAANSMQAQESEASSYQEWGKSIREKIANGKLVEAVSELQIMQDQAVDSKDYAGMATVNMIFGELYSNSYPVASANLDAALEYVKLSGDMADIPEVHRLWAESALANGHYPEAIDHAKAMAGASDSAQWQNDATRIILLSYLQQGDDANAKEAYTALRAAWDGGEVSTTDRKGVAKALALYLTKYGPAADLQLLAPEVGNDGDIDSLELEYAGMMAKRDYKGAAECLSKIVKLKDTAMGMQATTLAENADAYLRDNNAVSTYAQSQIDGLRHGNLLLTIFLCVAGALLVVSAYMIWKLRKQCVRLSEQREQAEAERQEEVRLSRMKSSFIHNMTHELRTPLNSIIGFNEILTNPDFRPSEEKRNEMLRHIHNQSLQLEHLLDNVVVLSRIDANDIVPNYEPVKLAEIVEEVVEPLYKKVAKDVSFNIERGLMSGIVINTDRDLVLNVVKATLENAVKFTKQGSVEFDCATDSQGNLTITVTDTGDGIPAEDSERIYERFEKLGRIEEGFGLGLSCSRELLDIMGGSIQLDTSYSRGARFVITILNHKKVEG